MNKEFKIPPKSVSMLTPPIILANWFSELVGTPFRVTGKTRTDGSNVRKLIASTLEKHTLPALADSGQYEIVPPKGKGVPKIAREFIDTYIVTSGNSYNLQVWNRIPASHTLLIKYESGESLKCSDVRFVFVRMNLTKHIISTIIILTPEYIQNRFGEFGKPTIKYQLLISAKARKEIYEKAGKVLSFPDTKRMSYYLTNDFIPPKSGMLQEPEFKKIFSISLLEAMVAKKLASRAKIEFCCDEE